MLGRYVQQLHGLGTMPLFDDKEMRDLKRATYPGAAGVFTHAPLTWATQRAEDLDYDSVIAPFVGRRVVFLTRHPLDVLVSSFMQAKFKVAASYPGELREFITDPVLGLDKLIRFHELWVAHRDETEGFLLVRYEDIHADPATQLRRLAAFIGESIDETAIAEAVAFASFDNLRKIESSGTRMVYKSSGFNAFGDGPRDNPNAFHVRKGEIAGYRTELPPDSILALENRVRVSMPAFYGYS